VEAHGDVPADEGRVWPGRRPLLRQGRARPAARPRDADPLSRRSPPDRGRRRLQGALRGRERAAGGAGAPRPGDRAQGLRPGLVRPERRSPAVARRADGARARGHRRPARAVELGRGLYDNLTKYIRFQMGVLFGLVFTFLGAAIGNVVGGVAFVPLQTLWVNFSTQVFQAVGLGYGEPAEGLMKRKPRDP